MPLTADYVRSILEYDPLTGVFRWRERPELRASRNTRFGGKVAGGPDVRGYTIISINRRQIKAHRPAWLHVYGKFPSSGLDHINRDKADNRIENLREGGQDRNALNRSFNLNNTTGGKGVIRTSSGKFMARVQRKGYHKYCKVFETLEDASFAYDVAAHLIHGGFAGNNNGTNLKWL